MRASLARVPAYSQGLVAVNDNHQTQDEGNQILLLLGRLEATVAAVQQDIAEIKTDAKEDRATTVDSRRRLHEKIEGLSSRVQKTESTIRVLGELVDRQGKDVAALTPTVEATAATVRNWTIRGGLVLGGLAALGGTIWWAITTYGVALWRFFDQFVPRG